MAARPGPLTGYADERIVFDPEWAVLATDLLADLNDYLKANGHRPWSDKTLAARARGHGAFTLNGVERTRARTASLKLSRPALLYEGRGPAPKNTKVYRGLRFIEEM